MRKSYRKYKIWGKVVEKDVMEKPKHRISTGRTF